MTATHKRFGPYMVYVDSSSRDDVIPWQTQAVHKYVALLKQHPNLLYPENPAPWKVKQNMFKLVQMGIDPRVSGDLVKSGLIME